MSPARLAAVGHYTPEQVLTNAQLIERFGLDIDAEWIESRTGIRSRHWLEPGQTTSDMVVRAARDILARARVEPAAVERLILATISPDQPSPSTATIVAHKLGLRCAAFDLSAACAGFLYGLETGAQAVAAGATNVLVMAADARSRFVDTTDVRSVVLFADGAAGALLVPGDEPGILATFLGAEARENKGAEVPAGGAARPASAATVAAGEHFLRVDGKREIFDLFVQFTRESVEAVLRETRLSLDDIDLFITHQGNAFMVHEVLEDLGIPIERAVDNVAMHGNTSGATVPIALSESIQSGRVGPGDRVLLTAVGAGYTFGSAVVQL